MVLLVAGLAACIPWKYVQRQRFLHRLRVARIAAQEVREMLDSGQKVMIVDLRHPLDVEVVPYVILGAIRMAVEEIERRHQAISRDREIILYCS